MPKNRLKDVTVEEISFVDEGDNPEAHIIFTKKKPMKTEGGAEYPAEAFAYVPDPAAPSSWKLRLWDSPADKETAAQVGRAVAALGEGYRGNKVQIPKEDLEGVKAKVLAAWKRTHEGEPPEVLTKQQGGEGMTPEELQAALDEANAKITELTAQIDAMKAEEEPEGEEDMMKSLPEAMRKRFEEMEKREKDAREALEKAADEKLETEWIGKAKEADLSDGVGKMLKSLAKTNEDMAKSIYDEMERLSKQVSEGELLKEKGASGTSSDPMEKVNAAAKEIRQADPKLTEAQAFAKAYQIHKGDM